MVLAVFIDDRNVASWNGTMIDCLFVYLLSRNFRDRVMRCQSIISLAVTLIVVVHYRVMMTGDAMMKERNVNSNFYS